MTYRVHIATSRDIGNKCLEWAKNNLPVGCILVDDLGDCDIIISVLYDKIIKKETLKNKKAFNYHPGILPDYRGSACSSWSIINKEAQSGVTLHLMDSGIDSGDIIAINKFDILKTDTAHSVNHKCLGVLYEMFKKNFKDIITGNYTAVKQELNPKIYYKKDLQNAKDLTRYIKAFHFPGKESAFYINSDGKKIYIEYK